MGNPVTWNPFGGNGYGAAPLTNNVASSPGANSNTSGAAHPTAGTYFQSYGNPFTPTSTAWQPLLSDDMATEGRSLAAKVGAVEQPDDVYGELIALSRLTQQVDGQLQILLQQPIDLAAAQGQVTAAQANQTQYLKQMYGALAPDQQQQLHSLSVAAEQAQGLQQQAAVSNFNQALDAVLTVEQRKTLLSLQRAVEDAQLNLQGQQLAKRILDARGGVAAPGPYGGPNGQGAQTLSLAMADGRAFLALRMQIQADRKVQDVYLVIMSPQMRSQLAPLQQELLAATGVLQQNPNAPWAQTRFDKAKADFDRVFGGLVNPQDREVLKNFEAYQRSMQNLAATLGDEADAEHTYYQLLDHPVGTGPNLPSAADQKSVLDLARAEFNLAQHNRNMRSLAARASTDCNQDLHKQATEALMQSMRMTADLRVMHAQINYDQAVQGPPRNPNPTTGQSPGAMTLVSYSTAPAAASTGAPVNRQAVTDAKQLLDDAKQSRQDLEQALAPPPPPPQKSGWDYAFDITLGVLETGGGILIAGLAGWTGIGAVAGGAMAVDGAIRLGHSISDATNGTVTDAPISAGLQKLGMSRRWANTADTGVALLVTVPAGGYGAYTGLVRGGLALKTASGVGLLTMADSTTAAGRSMVTGNAVDPFAVQGLTSVGLTHTQANYVLFGGNLLLTGGVVKAAQKPGASAAATEIAAGTTLKKPVAVTTSTATASPTTKAATATIPVRATTGTVPTSLALTTEDPLGINIVPVRAPAFAGNGGVTTVSAPPVVRPLVTVRIGNTVTALDETSWPTTSMSDAARRSARQQRVYPSGTGSQPRSSPLLVPSSAAQTDVAILGNGNVAITLAADVEMNSPLKPTVLMRPKGEDRIGPFTGDYLFKEVLRNTWHETQLGRRHFGYLNTPGGLEAMRQAKTIVVTIPDAPQTRLALFNDLQQTGLVNDPARTIVFIRGGQAGQPALSQIIRDNPSWRASVVLVEDSPYGTRVFQGPRTGPLLEADGTFIPGPAGEPILLGPGEHFVRAKRKEDVEISVAGHGADPVPGTLAMRDLFPLGETIGKPSWPDFNVVPGVAMPWRFGHAIHPGVAFDGVNLQMTWRGQQYLHYVEGVHPALGERLALLDQEKMQLAATYGAHSESFPMKLHRQFGLDLIPGESFYDTMQRTIKQDHIPGSKNIYTSMSYESIEKLMTSRYPQEDVPAVFTMNWYAQRAGIHLPEHALFEADLRSTLLELGMSQDELTNRLGAYLPILEGVEGGVPEITQLLNEPHIRPAA